MKLTREFYVRKNGTLAVTSDVIAVEVYYDVTADGKPIAQGFSGRKVKPDFTYSFTSEEKRDTYVTEYLNRLSAQHEEKQKRKQDRKEFKHSLKEGDILCSTWGYEQTNVDFYQVVEVSEKSVYLREVAQHTTETQWCQGKALPVKDSFVGEQFRVVVRQGNSVKISSYAHAYPHDGRAVSYSTYA